MSQEPEVADADKTRRQDVQQKSAQELVDRQSHQPLFVLVSGIAPAESNHAIDECNESMVGDRHAMSVLAQIAKRVLRAAKRAFGINHPGRAEQRPKPGREGLRILKRGEGSQLICLKTAPICLSSRLCWVTRV